MTTSLAWIVVILGALVGAGATMSLLGWMLPLEHVASRTVILPVPVATVWATLVDFPGQLSWRRGLSQVDRQPDNHGAEVWRERFGRNSVNFLTVEFVPSSRLVRQIADEHGPFQGLWEFHLEPVVSPTNARVTLTERGLVRNPFFRFVNRFVLGQATTLEHYLQDLAHKFGTEARFIPSLESQREADAPQP